ncbi:hypothetical protein [Streptomyces thermolineatus]|uniref:hypothetical protein n=1 Tax=Streptomyces thermolineatus TaxID=44033 RepID=UPI0031E2C1ED
MFPWLESPLSFREGCWQLGAAPGGLRIGRPAVDGEYFAGAVDEARVYSGVVDDMSNVRMAGLGGDSSL